MYVIQKSLLIRENRKEIIEKNRIQKKHKIKTTIADRIDIDIYKQNHG